MAQKVLLYSREFKSERMIVDLFLKTLIVLHLNIKIYYLELPRKFIRFYLIFIRLVSDKILLKKPLKSQPLN